MIVERRRTTKKPTIMLIEDDVISTPPPSKSSNKRSGSYSDTSFGGKSTSSRVSCLDCSPITLIKVRSLSDIYQINSNQFENFALFSNVSI